MKTTIVSAAVVVGLAAPAVYGAAAGPAATAAPRLERRVFPTDSASVAAFLSTVEPDQLSTYFSWAANGDSGFISHAQSFTSNNAEQYSSYLAEKSIDPAEASAILGGIGTKVASDAPAPTSATDGSSNGGDGARSTDSNGNVIVAASTTDANGSTVAASTTDANGSSVPASSTLSGTGASATGDTASSTAGSGSGTSSASAAGASATNNPDGALSLKSGSAAVTVLAAIAAYLVI